MDHWVSPVRERIPVLSDPGDLTRAVLDKLDTGERTKTGPAGIQAHPAGLTVRLRLAGAALVLLLFGVFLFQETVMWIRLDRLEDRMARKERDSGDMIRHRLISAEHLLGELTPSRMMTFHRKGREYVILEKEMLFALIERYGVLLSDRRDGPGARLNALLKGLGRLTWSDGLSAGELKTIYRNRDKLLARIQSETRTGGKNYAQKRLF
jgi:hypothetical protein